VLVALSSFCFSGVVKTMFGVLQGSAAVESSDGSLFCALSRTPRSSPPKWNRLNSSHLLIGCIIRCRGRVKMACQLGVRMIFQKAEREIAQENETVLTLGCLVLETQSKIRTFIRHPAKRQMRSPL
jgi:hypothetical protein